MDITALGSEEVTNTLVLGLIKMIHVRNSVLDQDGLVDPAKLKAVSRLGGSVYARVGEGFEIARPSWREMKEKIRGSS